MVWWGVGRVVSSCSSSQSESGKNSTLVGANTGFAINHKDGFCNACAEEVVLLGLVCCLVVVVVVVVVEEEVVVVVAVVAAAAVAVEVALRGLAIVFFLVALTGGVRQSSRRDFNGSFEFGGTGL